MVEEPLLVTLMRVVPRGEAAPAVRTSSGPACGRPAACGGSAATVTASGSRSVLKVLNTERVRAPVCGSNPSSDAPSCV